MASLSRLPEAGVPPFLGIFSARPGVADARQILTIEMRWSCSFESQASRQELIRKVITLLAALVFANPSGGAMGQTELQNKTLVQARFDAWRNGTGSPYDLLAEDVTWTIVGKSVASKTYSSRKAFITEVIQPFNARMSAPLKPTIRSLYATEDAVVTFFDAVGIARDGREYANTYAWFFEMRGGKVVKAYAFFDSITFNDLWQRVQPQVP